MLVIGLTGGISAGKTTVSQLFAQHHIPIIDADVIAREITNPGHPIFESIIAHFGKTLLQQDYTLNRARLRSIVFENEVERKWLESIMHPVIWDTIQQHIHALRKNTYPPPYCIVVIPLLFESHASDFLDRVLVVDATEEAQLSRTQKRDRLSNTQIEAIMHAQLTRKERLMLADDVIENINDLGELKMQVEALHVLYCDMSQTK